METEGTADTGSSEPQEVSVREAAEAAWTEHTAEPTIEESDQEETSQEETSPEETEVEAQEESQGEELDPIEYPSVVSNALREKLQQAPREAQEEIAEFLGSQQKSYSQKMRELSRVQSNYENLAEAIKPFEQSIAADGDSIDTRVSEMLTLDRALDADPINAILQLCAECEVDPRQLVGVSSGGYDPQLGQYQAQYSQANNELRQRQDAIEAKLQQQEMQSRAQQAISAYETWANETDSNGELVRPHVRLLEEQMVPIISEMRGQDPNASDTDILQAAYERVSDVYFKLINESKKKEVEKAKEKTFKAKKAASSVKGAPGGSVQQPKKEYKSVREAAEAAWNEHAH